MSRLDYARTQMEDCTHAYQRRAAAHLLVFPVPWENAAGHGVEWYYFDQRYPTLEKALDVAQHWPGGCANCGDDDMGWGCCENPKPRLSSIRTLKGWQE